MLNENSEPEAAQKTSVVYMKSLLFIENIATYTTAHIYATAPLYVLSLLLAPNIQATFFVYEVPFSRAESNINVKAAEGRMVLLKRNAYISLIDRTEVNHKLWYDSYSIHTSMAGPIKNHPPFIKLFL